MLAINAVLFAGEFGAAMWADSSALLADSADNLGDMLTYAISIAVVVGALHQRARAAPVKGLIQVAFGLAVARGNACVNTLPAVRQHTAYRRQGPVILNPRPRHPESKAPSS